MTFCKDFKGQLYQFYITLVSMSSNFRHFTIFPEMVLPLGATVGINLYVFLF